MWTHRNAPLLRIGTAGWAIPEAVRSRFPAEGSVLERYASLLTAVEINSSFYRSHRASTYERWAATTPAGFRFAVKIPKSITHDRRLRDCEALFQAFIDEIASLGDRLGPLLVQLPPSLAFDHETADVFFAMMSGMSTANVVCEPRHPSWFTADVDAFLADRHVARVAADPPVCAGASLTGGWSGLQYTRLHGRPRVYWSDYPPEALRAIASELLPRHDTERWLIFDNTAAGAALSNALDVAAIIASGT